MNQFEEGLLKYLSEDQLKKIQSVKIGIGGAGGLGSNVALILVRSGFKDLEIIDFDNIEASNLNRQNYYLDDIGKPKAETLKNYLMDINPDAKIITHHKKWDKISLENIFKDRHIIIEAFDHPSQKKDFVEYYQDKADILISGNGMAGLDSKQDITTKRINNIFIVGDNVTDTQKGHPPMAPRVISCAAKMAEIALDLSLGFL